MESISFFQATLKLSGNRDTTMQGKARMTARNRTSSCGVSIHPSRYPNQIVADFWCVRTASAESTKESSATVDKSITPAGRGIGYV
jgi:hypothetical protein